MVWMLLGTGNSFAKGGPGLFQFYKGQVGRLPIEEMKVRTDIMGSWAITRFDIQFGKPKPTAGSAKGEFLFGLRPGDEILSAQLVELIERELGDSTWTEKRTVRGRRAPAAPKALPNPNEIDFHTGWLVPSGQEILRMGVITIPEDGLRIRLAIKHPLEFISGDLKCTIPLYFRQNVSNFKLDICIHDAGYLPLVQSGSDLKLRFRKYKGDYQAKAIAKDYHPNTPVSLLVPADYQDIQVWYGKSDSTTNFMVHLATDMEGERRGKPERLALWWDEVGRAALNDRENEIELLSRYFRSLRNAEVEVVKMGYSGGEWQSFTVVNGDWSAVEEFIRSDAFNVPQTPIDWAKVSSGCEEALYFSHQPYDRLLDQLEDFQKSYCPLIFLLNSAPQANPDGLRILGNNARFKAIDLYDLEARNARQLLTQATYQVKEIKISQKRIPNLYLRAGQPFPGTLNFLGKLKGRSGLVDIKMGTPDRKGERYKVRLRPYTQTRTKASLVDLIARGPSQRMVFPRTLDEYVHADLVTSQSLNLWVRPLRLLKERKDEALQQAKTDQRMIGLDRVQDTWADVLDWYGDQYDPNQILGDPTFRNIKPFPVPPGPALALEIYPSPQLFIGPDTLYGPELPTDVYLQAKTVRWLSASHLKAKFGVMAAGGVWYVSDMPNDNRADSLLLLPEWQADPPYLKGLNRLSDGELTYRFFSWQSEYANNPSFYLDFADQMILRGMRDAATNVLHFLPELGITEPEVLRAVGHRLNAWDQLPAAIRVFSEVARAHPQDPIAHRDLAMAHWAAGHTQQAIVSCGDALKCDYRLFESRYPGVISILAKELNRARMSDTMETKGAFPYIASPISLDLRVTIEWTRSDTDVDLWVTDPDGVVCNYDRPVTSDGGTLSGDVTNGFGPEEYVIKEAKDGVYTIEVEYEDDPERFISGPNFVKVTVTTNYGRDSEETTLIPLLLEQKSAKVMVARIRIG